MPDTWSHTLIPTARQAPADAEVPSHQLMLQAGLIARLGSGTYTYLPIGLRALHKAMAIVREEMANADCAEIFMPTLCPIELWEAETGTGRRQDYGDNLFVVKDRHGRELALGPTHEEVCTDLAGRFLESYKDLPLSVYQIQTKFRDEFRPRFGVLRSREFQMKDAYSFHLKLEGGEGSGSLDETYQKIYDAYVRIFDRCGVPAMVVEAESGPIGGSASHEFMIPSPTGEDTILSNDTGYAANAEKCEIGQRPHDLSGEPTGELEEVATPDCPGIDDVITCFKKQLKTKLKKQNMLKCVLMVAVHADEPKQGEDLGNAEDPWYVLAVVRSDHDVNEPKVRQLMAEKLGRPVRLEMAPEVLAKQDGWAIGFIGPDAVASRTDTYAIIDPDAAQGGFWVTGANKKDHHVKHFNWQRDLMADADASRIAVADIRSATAGDPAPESRGGGTLRETKGIEVGHVFKLGCKYTEALDITVSDENNKRVHPLMGCYGIGVNRILAGAIERDAVGENPPGHDDDGIIWPRAIAPYQVIITPIQYAPDNAVGQMVAKLAAELEQHAVAGKPVDVLIDDRDERPGVKFKDADLIGIPVRITVGNKGLAKGVVEVKARDGRTGNRGEEIATDQAVARVIELLTAM